MSRLKRLVLVAALLAPAFIVKLWDPDPWWHLATGRWIVEHHALPTVDPFSFTMGGAPWRAVDWLADLVMFGAFRVGGDLGIGLLTAACAFSIVVLLGLLLRELAVDELPAAGLLVCVAVMVQARLSMARPLTIGALLLCATLFVLGRTWRRHDRSAILAAPILCAWSAVHPTALAGLALVVTFVASAMVLRHPRWRLYLGTALVTLAFMLLEPSARSLFALALSHDRSPLTLSLTLEWKPSELGNRELWLPALATLFALFAVIRHWREALPFIGSAALGAALASRYARNLTEAILLATPLWGLALQRAIERLKIPRARLWIAITIALVVPALHVQLAPEAFNTHFGLGPEEGAVPVETLSTLRALPPARVMNDCTLGGWLIWQRVPVYCDGRAVALYQEDDVRRIFLPLYQGAAEIEAACDRFDMHYLLARGDSDFEKTLMRSPEFLPIAYDRDHSLFVRRRYAENLPGMEELRFVNDPRWLDDWYGAIAADPARTARLERELMQQRAPSRTVGAVMVYLRRAQPALAQKIEQR